MGIDFKTQTNRSTKFHRNITNINLFCKGFEFGIITSEYWGNFEPREEPLIEMEINGVQYQIPLNEFIKRVKPILRGFKA